MLGLNAVLFLHIGLELTTALSLSMPTSRKAGIRFVEKVNCLLIDWLRLSLNAALVLHIGLKVTTALGLSVSTSRKGFLL